MQVLDFGYTEAGEPFLVMEHVKGNDLDTVIERRGALPIAEAITLAVQLCSALEHAHYNEVVHRDLKPSNIMIDTNNSVRVLDFGLARILNIEETDWRLTRPGQPGPQSQLNHKSITNVLQIAIRLTVALLATRSHFTL